MEGHKCKIRHQSNYYMSRKQLSKDTNVMIKDNDQLTRFSILPHGLSRNLKHHNKDLQQQIQKKIKSQKRVNKQKRTSFSLNTSANQLRDVSNEFQPEILKRQLRYLPKMDKKMFESSLQEVSPWNANYTPRETSNNKLNFSKERQKIKQMLYEYKLSKTINERTQQHANFIKNSRNKNKKVNVVHLQYGGDSKAIQRPSSLIKSVDVTQSYESYLNNNIELQKALFLLPQNIKPSNHRQAISSCRLHTKQTQSDKEHNRIKDHLFELLQDQIVHNNYIDELKSNVLRSNITKENQNEMTIRKKIYVQSRVDSLKNDRNRKGLKELRGMKDSRQVTKDESPQFQISGNKAHKLQYHQTFSY